MTTGPAAPHPLILAVAEKLLAELERQADVGRPGPYVAALGDLREVNVDGYLDLVALAAAIVEVVEV